MPSHDVASTSSRNTALTMDQDPAAHDRRGQRETDRRLGRVTIPGLRDPGCGWSFIGSRPFRPARRRAKLARTYSTSGSTPSRGPSASQARSRWTLHGPARALRSEQGHSARARPVSLPTSFRITSGRAVASSRSSSVWKGVAQMLPKVRRRRAPPRARRRRSRAFERGLQQDACLGVVGAGDQVGIDGATAVAQVELLPTQQSAGATVCEQTAKGGAGHAVRAHRLPRQRHRLRSAGRPRRGWRCPRRRCDGPSAGRAAPRRYPCRADRRGGEARGSVRWRRQARGPCQPPRPQRRAVSRVTGGGKRLPGESAA